MSENNIRNLARLKAKPGKESGLRSLLGGLVEPTRNESGCISYELLVNKEDAAEFTFVEKWKDDDAINAHFETEHIKKALNVLPELLSQNMDLRKYDTVE